MPSIVYRVNDDELKAAIKNSTSIRQVLLSLNLNETGTAYRIFKRRVKNLSIDTSHFTGKAHLKGKKHNWATKTPLKTILVKNSSYGTSYLKKRLIDEGLLEYKCYGVGCGITAWLGKPIVLQLDHINGDPEDHRLKNLRLLCPNCHSMTETFAGKNKGKSGANGGT